MIALNLRVLEFEKAKTASNIRYVQP